MEDPTQDSTSIDFIDSNPLAGLTKQGEAMSGTKARTVLRLVDEALLQFDGVHVSCFRAGLGGQGAPIEPHEHHSQSKALVDAKLHLPPLKKQKKKKISEDDSESNTDSDEEDPFGMNDYIQMDDGQMMKIGM